MPATVSTSCDGVRASRPPSSGRPRGTCRLCARCAMSETRRLWKYRSSRRGSFRAARAAVGSRAGARGASRRHHRHVERAGARPRRPVARPARRAAARRARARGRSREKPRNSSASIRTARGREHRGEHEDDGRAESVLAEEPQNFHGPGRGGSRSAAASSGDSASVRGASGGSFASPPDGAGREPARVRRPAARARPSRPRCAGRHRPVRRGDGRSMPRPRIASLFDGGPQHAGGILAAAYAAGARERVDHPDGGIERRQAPPLGSVRVRGDQLLADAGDDAQSTCAGAQRPHEFLGARPVAPVGRRNRMAVDVDLLEQAARCAPTGGPSPDP